MYPEMMGARARANILVCIHYSLAKHVNTLCIGKAHVHLHGMNDEPTKRKGKKYATGTSERRQNTLWRKCVVSVCARARARLCVYKDTAYGTQTATVHTATQWEREKIQST